jgi:hypothetical protein
MGARDDRTTKHAAALALVSPPVLFATVWVLAGIIAWRVLARPDQNPLAHLFITRHRLDLAAFSSAPILWAVTLSTVLALGYALAGRGLGKPARPTHVADDIAARRVFWINAVFLGVTLAWVGLTMRAAGGVSAFIALSKVDPISARDLLLDRKLFVGMRLLYAGLPALAALAGALVARGQLGPAAQRSCIVVILVNIVALVFLTAVMSQRLLVLQLVVSLYVAASCARGRLLPFWSVLLASAVFVLSWVMHESIINPGLTQSANEIAAQKFAFYAVNDLWNTVRPLAGDAPRGGGLFTFQFAFFFTLTDGIVYSSHADRLDALLAYRGGGEFSLLSAPFVDFGPFGAAAYLLLYGAVVRVLWHRAFRSAGDAAIYGQAAVAVVLSVHANFAASQDFVFALLVILAATRLPAHASARQSVTHAAA